MRSNQTGRGTEEGLEKFYLNSRKDTPKKRAFFAQQQKDKESHRHICIDTDSFGDDLI